MQNVGSDDRIGNIADSIAPHFAGKETYSMHVRFIEWEPTKPESWASALGLICVSMFGSTRRNAFPGEHAVLLDGRAASFAVSITTERELAFEDSPLAWSWSSNLRHHLVIDPEAELMFLRQWDWPRRDVRSFRLPQNSAAAFDLLALCQKSAPPKAPDVILHVLKAFRQVRAALSADELAAMRAFNGLLLAAENMQGVPSPRTTLRRCQTLEDVFGLLTPEQKQLASVEQLPRSALQSDLGALLQYFVEPEYHTHLALHVDLLLRHAAGQLYQEAHLRIERDYSRQSFLPGFADDRFAVGDLRRDVRFTPVALARTLAQQAIRNLDVSLSEMQQIEVLDPACGSGVFLQEVLRELIACGFRGRIVLRGMDVSDISAEVARFCLTRTVADTEGIANVSIDILCQDALRSPWGTPQIVLMNPPFIPWERMSPEDQTAVAEILGPLKRGRVDMAMAFIWKAVEALPSGATFATVLPAPLFETQSGEKWRETIGQSTEIVLMGRLEGYNFFSGSAVEPGFLVLRKPVPCSQASNSPIVFYSREGFEDTAFRALRRDDIPSWEKDWEIYPIEPNTLRAASWLPRSHTSLELVQRLQERGLLTAEALFDIHQGIRTGLNKAFVISAQDLRSLPKREREFFRPIASNSTIQQGVLTQNEYLFYPYDADGPTIISEEQLTRLVPRFSERWLFPNKEALEGRAGAPQEWWLLVRPRSWHGPETPKLVSSYFGYRGSFAFDTQGDSVVLQGHAWMWKGRSFSGAEDETVDFEDTPFPWAYLALLNSPTFEALLQHFCPRVAGGQFNLSKRFVGKVFLPDLSDELGHVGGMVEELARMGRRIAAGDLSELAGLTNASAKAYGIPADLVTLDEHV